MLLTVRSDSDKGSPHQKNDKNQNKIPTYTTNTDKNIDCNLEVLGKLRKDHP